METVDVHGNRVGTFYANNDRLGFNTPDPDATDILRPYLTVPYPAPWLPTKRQDLAHPVGANKVMSVGYLVGMDKSGALIPAGYFSGNTGKGGEWCLVKYAESDTGWAHNPKTGNLVTAGGQFCLLAAPDEAGTVLAGVTADCTQGEAKATLSAVDGKVWVGTYIAIAGVAGVKRITAIDAATKVVDLDSAVDATVDDGAVTYGTPTIAGITPQAADITFAKTCDLIPGSGARAVGYAIRDIYQYIGGVTVLDTTGGISYTLDGVIPVKFKVHNYKHEAGNAVQTCFGLRFPWIGATPTKLQELADADGVAGYSQTDFSRSFVHFTGAIGNKPGQLFRGSLVVPSTFQGDAGHYMPFDSAKHDIDQVVGRVIGIESMYPIRDYMDRVRTQFDRSQSFVGPFKTANPQTGMMGGSATRGMDTTISYGTNGLFRTALDQGKTIHAEYATYVYVAVRTL